MAKIKKKKIIKKKMATKKLSNQVPEGQIAIGLHNLFPYIVATLNAIEKKIDRLQITVDAVGKNTVDIINAVEE